MSKKEIIGFIGVGYMGAGMAKNIVTKGYSLYILGNKKRDNIERLVGLGAVEVASPKEMAEKCDIIHLCVSNSTIVEQIIMGDNGILSSGKDNLIIIDTSTSDPVSTMKINDACRQKNMFLVDAPLGRTPVEAEAGTLDCMVGADDDIFEKIKPVLATWSANIIYLGAVGNGHKMKLINNFISLGYGALYAEALALTQKSGLTIDQFHQVIGSGRMANGFYQTFMKYAHGGDKNAHKFTLENALKDLNYGQSMAVNAKVHNPIQAAVRNSYALAIADNKGDDFVPQLCDVIAKANGIK